MNEKKMSIYHEIHRLHRLGFNKSQIERKVGVNRETVRKYLAKDFEEMSEWTFMMNGLNLQENILSLISKKPVKHCIVFYTGLWI